MRICARSLTCCEPLTYHNPENGFAVLKVLVKGHPDLVTTMPHRSITEQFDPGIWSIGRISRRKSLSRRAPGMAPSCG